MNTLQHPIVNLFLNDFSKNANLKENIKVNVRQAIEKIEENGFSMFCYRQARSYKLKHGYFSLYFENKAKKIIMLQCSNDEQTSLSLYACLRLSKFLFCPVFELFKIKSHGNSNLFKFFNTLANMQSILANKLDEFSNLINSLEQKELNAFQFQNICKNAVTYRNYKLKSNRYFHFIPDSNGYNLLVSLLSELLSSESNNNEYHRLIENMRQIDNICNYTIDQIVTA